jgi:hypothetical protein
MKRLALTLMALTICVIALSTAIADEFKLPIISVTPNPYDFGQVPIGAIANGSLLVSNNGDMPLIVTAVKTKAPFGDGATSFTVPPGGSRRVKIWFQPTSEGYFTGPCTFLSNAANDPAYTATLNGEGVAP